jgi:uncharacterized membrane protein
MRRAGGMESESASSRVGFVRAHAWSIALAAAVLGWAIVLYAIARDHFVSFRLARFDLGNMVQAVWSTAQGRPLETTDALGEQMTRLGAHVDPILVLLAPLWVVAPTPLVLVAVQVAAVGLGAVPVFLLARRHSGSDTAAGLLALAYLLYPWIAWTAVDAFHPVTLAIPLLLLCVWFLDSDRLAPFALCAVLALGTGELMGIVVGALGLWYAIARGRRRAGLAIAGAGAAWTLIALYAVVPAFSDGSSRFYGFYEEVGGSPFGIMRTAISDPVTVVSAATQGADALYLFLLAAPLAGAFLLAPGLAAVAVPQLAANLLADLPSATDPHAHYIAAVVPFLFAATAAGLGRLSTRAGVRVVGVVLTLSIAASIMAGPWPGAVIGPPTFLRTDASSEKFAALRAAVDLVPEAAPVASTNRVGSHLAARRYAYSVPTLGRAEWIVLDLSDTWVPGRAGGRWSPGAIGEFRKRVEQSPEWVRVLDRSGVLVFRKAQP